MERFLENGDMVFATGVLLEYFDGKFVVSSFEDDTFFDGRIVEDIENNPYVDEG